MTINFILSKLICNPYSRLTVFILSRMSTSSSSLVARRVVSFPCTCWIFPVERKTIERLTYLQAFVWWCSIILFAQECSVINRLRRDSGSAPLAATFSQFIYLVPCRRNEHILHTIGVDISTSLNIYKFSKYTKLKFIKRIRISREINIF